MGKAHNDQLGTAAPALLLPVGKANTTWRESGGKSAPHAEPCPRRLQRPVKRHGRAEDKPAAKPERRGFAPRGCRRTTVKGSAGRSAKRARRRWGQSATGPKKRSWGPSAITGQVESGQRAMAEDR